MGSVVFLVVGGERIEINISGVIEYNWNDDDQCKTMHKYAQPPVPFFFCYSHFLNLLGTSILYSKSAILCQDQLSLSLKQVKQIININVFSEIASSKVKAPISPYCTL